MVNFVSRTPQSPPFLKAGTNRPARVSDHYRSSGGTDNQDLSCYVHEDRTSSPACWREIWGAETILVNFVQYIDKIVIQEIGKDLRIPDIVLPADTGFPEFLASLGKFCAKESDGHTDYIENIIDLFWTSCNLKSDIKKSGGNGKAFQIIGFGDKKQAWIVSSDASNSARRPDINDYVNYRNKPPIAIRLQQAPLDICLIKPTELWIIPVPDWGNVNFMVQEDQLSQGQVIDIVIAQISKVSCSNIDNLFDNRNSTTGFHASDSRKDITLRTRKEERANVDGYSVSQDRWTIKVINITDSSAGKVSIFKMRKGCILITADNLAVAIRIAALNLALGR